jgi:hypothetical protein
MTASKIERIELGRRDYSNNIYAKVHTSNHNEWQPMLIDPDADIAWQHHIVGKRIEVPGGVLYRSGNNCDCFTKALMKFESFNGEIDRIAAEYDADFLEVKAEMYLKAYDCTPHEVAERMDIDDPHRIYQLAKQFEDENCDSIFINTASNCVVDAMRFR